MVDTKSKEGISFQDSLTSGEPLTHFFYEWQGERAVEPLLLIENGVTLWHEHIYTDEAYDNSYLWDLAKEIVEDHGDTPMYSWAEWVRYQITTGAFIPAQWDSRKAYPYKGLLISAIYFQEARRLCAQGNPERAWHLIALAYYHLGLNTGLSTRQNTSRAAKVMHAARTEKVRALVLGALDKVRRDGSARSMESAKDQVVELMREKHDQIKHWLNEFDTLVPEKTKGRTVAKQKNDVFVRIRNMLDNWSLPSGPYPDIAEAFSHFSKRKRTPPHAEAFNPRATSENVPIDESDFYLRLINFWDDGTVLTVKVSRNEDA
ncbi:hypothetical protein LJR125_003714 [Pseudoxanthomonas sp. LjRoot125]|uniref:hypothetical protein n=1 Tax=Pseudoxanthomonas sp. LjRoot125 TaxID=3342258 RepID=UPI003E11D7AF